jgi:hypothetical protein
VEQSASSRLRRAVLRLERARHAVQTACEGLTAAEETSRVGPKNRTVCEIILHLARLTWLSADAAFQSCPDAASAVPRTGLDASAACAALDEAHRSFVAGLAGSAEEGLDALVPGPTGGQQTLEELGDLLGAAYARAAGQIEFIRTWYAGRDTVF